MRWKIEILSGSCSFRWSRSMQSGLHRLTTGKRNWAVLLCCAIVLQPEGWNGRPESQLVISRALLESPRTASIRTRQTARERKAEKDITCDNDRELDNWRRNYENEEISSFLIITWSNKQFAQQTETKNKTALGKRDSSVKLFFLY
jgi:hypothetical protein